MEEKKADNKFINIKKEIEEVDSKIEDSKSYLKDLNGLEEELISLKKSIDKCVELLHESIKGGNIEKVLDSISEDNAKNISDTTKMLDEKRLKIEKNIRDLNNKKEEIKKDKE